MHTNSLISCRRWTLAYNGGHKKVNKLQRFFIDVTRFQDNIGHLKEKVSES